MLRRTMLFLSIGLIGLGACRSADFPTSPAKVAANGAASLDCSTEIIPTEACTVGSGTGGNGDFSQPSFPWPFDFAVVFQVGGVTYSGTAQIVTPVGFSGTQPYNFVGTSFFSGTCIGEITLTVGEAGLMAATGSTNIDTWSIQGCF